MQEDKATISSRAIHRALLLPEIIANILQTGIPIPGFLYTCLFINKVFNLEASRILWYGCGRSYNSATAGHVTPDIRHLAQIALRDAERAQFYANFVHVLRFDYEDEYYEEVESKYHTTLTKLQFPQLRDITFARTHNSTAFNKGDLIIHYLQPNLRHFHLYEGFQLSDSFLDALGTRCPKLRRLTLNTNEWINWMTKEGLVRLLEALKSLETFDIRTGFQMLWSSEAFNALSKYNNLELLSIPFIEDSWIQNMGDMPKLNWLYSRLTERGLVHLAAHTPNLSTLCLDFPNKSPSHHALASVAHFSLKHLSINFSPDSSISGQELISLAQSCPELEGLSVSGDPSHPSGIGISDATIDIMAKRLLNLKSLSFFVSHPTSLSFKSILSLGQHCKELEELELSCSVDWNEIQGIPKDRTILQLWNLHIDLPPERRWVTDQETINKTTERLASLMPKLTSFVLKGAGEGEEQIEEQMNDICLERD